MLTTHAHLWQPAPHATRTFLLLHGTGGNEHSLAPLAAKLDPSANILAPRGNVLEHAMPRFFRRLAEGVFDMEDLLARTHALGDWLDAAQREYRFKPAQVTAIGYSNGANTLAALLLLRPHLAQTTLTRVALLRPMVPFTPSTVPMLAPTRVFVSAGLADRITPAKGPAGAQALAQVLETAGAHIHLALDEGDHALNHRALEALMHWDTTTRDDAPAPRPLAT